MTEETKPATNTADQIAELNDLLADNFATDLIDKVAYVIKSGAVLGLAAFSMSKGDPTGIVAASAIGSTFVNDIIDAKKKHDGDEFRKAVIKILREHNELISSISDQLGCIAPPVAFRYNQETWEVFGSGISSITNYSNSSFSANLIESLSNPEHYIPIVTPNAAQVAVTNTAINITIEPINPPKEITLILQRIPS